MSPSNAANAAPRSPKDRTTEYGEGEPDGFETTFTTLTALSNPIALGYSIQGIIAVNPGQVGTIHIVAK